jgi:hypothetical protein
MGLELSSTINSEWESSFRFPRNRQKKIIQSRQKIRLILVYFNLIKTKNDMDS